MFHLAIALLLSKVLSVAKNLFPNKINAADKQHVRDGNEEIVLATTVPWWCGRDSLARKLTTATNSCKLASQNPNKQFKSRKNLRLLIPCMIQLCWGNRDSI